MEHLGVMTYLCGSNPTQETDASLSRSCPKNEKHEKTHFGASNPLGPPGSWKTNFAFCGAGSTPLTCHGCVTKNGKVINVARKTWLPSSWGKLLSTQNGRENCAISWRQSPSHKHKPHQSHGLAMDKQSEQGSEPETWQVFPPNPR